MWRREALVGVALTFVLAALTALATGFGVLPVYGFRMGEKALGFLWGLSASVMAAISVLDLILPALRDPGFAGIGIGSGLIFVVLAAIWLDQREEAHDHESSDPQAGLEEPDGHAHAHGALGPNPLSSLSLLLFLVFTVHSAPEGIGIGSALKESSTVGLIVTFAIGLHNIPEGTAIAVGLRADGVPMGRAFVAAVVTSLPQPLLAPIVFLVVVGPWLSLGMGFAGGAMLSLVARELVPEGLENNVGTFALGVLAGLAVAILLNLAFPVPSGI